MSQLNGFKNQAKGILRDILLKLSSCFIRPNQKQLAFIPHAGMYENGYDLVNYKSDNALSLLYYMLEKYGSAYSYRVACDSRHYKKMKDDISKNYSGIDIIPLRFFGPGGSRISAFKELMKSKYIFTCEESALPFKRKWHTHVFLSYFKPFKDDYAYHHISKEEQCNNPLDICVSTSSTYSNIVAHAYDVSFSKFAVLGFSRDDMLLSKYDCPALDKAIKEAVDYEVKHVILYTPTHRDYETNNGTKRDVMGFRMNVERLETYLRTNNILLICKLHTKQNSDVIGSHNIKGLIVHTPSNDFGLCELLQRADVLITDYTSTYFDYLLLDRPVLFNFYDFDKYNATRGFSFDPLSSILAGGIFKDEASFYLTLEKAIGGNDGFKEKRHFVRDLMHKYIDCNSSERICKYVLG